MNPLQTVLAVLIAAGAPAAFLLIIYTLDLYASRTFRLVVLCFGWGAVGAFGLSYLLNTYIGLPLGRALGATNPYLLLTVAIAPVIEETVKSLSLFYVSRRSEFTYFVDGAIYGFAAGIGFSIIENFLYLSQNPGMGIPLALIRSFSTCLMHGTAAGLVGAAVGRFRFRRRSGQGLGMVGGWLAAILLHALFNGISRTPALSESLTTVVAVGIGLAGVGLIGFFINLGLREEQQWLAETLDRRVGVTAAESRMVQSYASLDEFLQPIIEQFPREAEQVEAFLLRQAQLGIKRKVQQRVSDPKLQEQLGQEVAQLQAEMNQIRRDVGVYVMSYVRSVFPDEALPIWSRLEHLAAQGGSADLQRWSQMLTTETSGPPRQSIFASLQER
ncbi:MAG: PrsW family glutamic-type intramembrane protease [Chloroflexota bacterium]|nr:PrsW family glutamic-type intramembrane protease [Chloroflexota bacterium]